MSRRWRLTTPGRVSGRPAAAALCAAAAAAALAGGAGHAAMPDPAVEADPHAHHHASVPDVRRTLAEIALPDLALVSDAGRPVSLLGELNDDGRPVVLTFIYTSCTTVCPVTSLTLAQLQEMLGAARDQVHVMSISIDPEFDTPARLRDYAARYGAGPEWQHYTGTLAASQAAQRAFDVYRGNKMDHVPAVFVRPLPGAKWVRLDGYVSADQLLAELPASCAAARP